jgi:hypothetical protein
MFTRCPNCQQKQALTVGQLRTTRGILHCNRCAVDFDALELLTEFDPEPVVAKVIANDDMDLPWETPLLEIGPISPLWRIGVVAGLLLFLGQLLYFEGGAWVQNDKLRKRLIPLCQALACRLPTYQNADALATLRNALDTLPDQTHLFVAAIHNQAEFSQAYPKLELTLLDYNGQALGRRLFRPEDYLFNASGALILPDSTVELRLVIAPTRTPVGGYHFNLIY